MAMRLPLNQHEDIAEGRLAFAAVLAFLKRQHFIRCAASW
jgi:hypothetical protein